MSLDTRIFAYWVLNGGSVEKRRNTDSLEAAVYNLNPMEVLQTLGCPVQLLHIVAEEAAGKAESRTSSSLWA